MMSKTNKWIIGNYNRSLADFESYNGEYASAQEACAAGNMQCWVYDSAKKAHVPYDPATHSNADRVECGNSAYAAANPYRVAFRLIELKLTSQTRAVLPQNRDRTVIGVGEVVTVYANMPTEWQIQGAADVKFYSSHAEFTAPDNAGRITVKATSKQYGRTYVKELKFNIIEPEGLAYEQSYYDSKHTQPMIYHPKNSPEAMLGLRMRVLPLSVNFSALEMLEEDSVGINTGAFATGEARCHRSSKVVNGECQPTGAEVPQYAAVHDFQGKHNFLGDYDLVGQYLTKKGKNMDLSAFPDSSTTQFNISFRWRLRSWDNDDTDKKRYKVLPVKIKQSLTLKNNGNITISKGNFSRTLKASEVFDNDAFLKANPYYPQ